MAKGDIRVLIALDIILSAIYATAVIWGLNYLDLVAFTWQNVAMATAALAMITYIFVLQ
jgi:hypothetical protein